MIATRTAVESWEMVRLTVVWEIDPEVKSSIANGGQIYDHIPPGQTSLLQLVWLTNNWTMERLQKYALRYMLFEMRSQLKVNLMSIPWYYSSVEHNPVQGCTNHDWMCLSVVFSKCLVCHMPSCKLTLKGDTATEFDTMSIFSLKALGCPPL